MARPRAPKPVKLLVGLLSGDPDLLRRARQLLVRRYGPVDLESDLWPFDQTDYYEPKMGPGLQRVFLSLERPIPPAHLAQVKLETNGMEREIGDQCLLPDIPRPVNIDPGYIELSKLVLATTKDASHRVYLGEGIFAEVTLRYSHGGWQSHEWTYPDYGLAPAQAFFSTVRARLLAQRRDTPDG